MSYADPVWLSLSIIGAGQTELDKDLTHHQLTCLRCPSAAIIPGHIFSAKPDASYLAAGGRLIQLALISRPT
jgi:hypothetical protein